MTSELDVFGKAHAEVIALLVNGLKGQMDDDRCVQWMMRGLELGLGMAYDSPDEARGLWECLQREHESLGVHNGKEDASVYL